MASSVIAPDFTGDDFYLHELTLIPASLNDYNHYEIWDEITYSFQNFNGLETDK